MPGFAGSSGYYLRYMDPGNNERYFSKEANEYWKDIDLYLGGDEHAAGHLIYARFWNKFLFDLGMVCEDEPFKKLINQGKIQGRSSFVYRVQGKNEFVSYNLRKDYDTVTLHVDIGMVENDVLDVEAFRNWRPEFKDATFILEEDKYICGWEIEKMSKSKHNVQSPDEIIHRYGADTLRMYEMFLGPIELHKPWDTNGIEGVFRFLKKYWRLFFNQDGELILTDDKPSAAELKVLHKTIRKVQEDIERFSFNTAVSTFMICVNELSELGCNKRSILEPLNILLSPYAPHISEELWQLMGHDGSITEVPWPEFREEYVAENTFTYPVSFNGKLRFKLELPLDMPRLELPLDMPREEMEKQVLENEQAEKWISGKPVRKVIIVPGKIINVVV
jgi:leucyl-tRNA synthetase